jgi:predicted ribosomally synthesized peptide with SipW-like signal peptide
MLNYSDGKALFFLVKMFKVAKSLLIISVVGVLTVKATTAVWSDSAQSTGNVFQAGTLDLKLSDGNETQLDNVTLTWNGTAMTPGGSTATASLLVRNTGNPAADHVHFDVTSNTISEGAGAGSGSANPMDANLEITVLTYDGVSILGFLNDGNGNGRKDLDDWETLAAAGIGDHDGALLPADGTLPLSDLNTDHTLLMTVQLASSAPNENQGDSVTTVLTVSLHQIDGQ